MSKPYQRISFLTNYSTLFLLALAFAIARCKKDDQHTLPEKKNIRSAHLPAGTAVACL